MSSYELLELLEFLPEDSALKSAIRGEYSSEQLVWRHIAGELSKLRAITESVNSRKSAEMKTFPTMAEMREAAETIDETTERREHFYMFADKTPRNEQYERYDYEDDDDDRRAV